MLLSEEGPSAKIEREAFGVATEVAEPVAMAVELPFLYAASADAPIRVETHAALVEEFAADGNETAFISHV